MPLKPCRLLASLLALAAVFSAQSMQGQKNSISDELAIIELHTEAPLRPAPEHPGLEVFASGRVVVHHPAYSRLPATQEAWMNEADIFALVDMIVKYGILDFDRRSIKQQLIEVQRRREEETGGVPVILDAGTIHLTLRFDPERFPETLTLNSEQETRVAWTALAQTAEWYPEIEAIRKLDRVVGVLLELKKRTGTAPEPSREVSISDLVQPFDDPQ